MRIVSHILANHWIYTNEFTKGIDQGVGDGNEKQFIS